MVDNINDFTRAAMRREMTFEEASARLTYNPETGEVRWRDDPIVGLKMRGKAACHVNSQGYVRLGCMGVPYNVHRVAWLLHYGEWPAGQVDHINGDRADNRIVNLRLADNSQNQANARVSPRSTTGIKGVRHAPAGRWEAVIKHKGKQRRLGLFGTREEAAEAYAQAAREVFGEFARPEARDGGQMERV